MNSLSLRGPGWCGVLLGVLLTAGVFAADYGFRIVSAELVLEGNDYVLNADIDYRFSKPAIEALRNGVPLTLVLSLGLKRERTYWWDETVLNERRLLHIRYHPLAKFFQLVDESSGAPRNFASLTALLEAMGSIRHLPALPADRLRKDERYWASLSVGLDIESLPLPLRPVAYVTPAWYLASSRYRWLIAD
ncbi:MAG TPA: DUF4390 domain-containing protein [Methylococcaceae bacterium]|jgi:hypothetical protein|nr:DUF4390 domain-containing protein [Methylococcaceae bacterium]